jgi:HSP20 family protein
MTLPCTVKEDKVQAEFHDGVLTITLPKTEEAKTHKVKIKTNGGVSKT